MAASLAEQLQRILDSIKSRSVLEEVGEFVVDMIKERVRGEGKGVKYDGANTSNLAPLSAKWIAARARDKRLHPDTTPETSNLTHTGEMLDGLYFVIRDGKLVVTVKPGAALKKATFTNETRPWVNISRGEATKIRQFVERIVKAKL